MNTSLIRAMVWLSHQLEADYFQNLASPPDEKPIYKHQHRDLGSRGGTPRSKEINALETWIDFKKSVDQGNFEEALPNYFKLRKWLNL